MLLYLTNINVNKYWLMAHPHGIVQQNTTQCALANVSRATHHHLITVTRESRDCSHDLL